jgi:hypothetical protein
MHPGTSLTDKMREWATPVASMVNYDEAPENFEARSERLEAEGSRPLGANLGQQSKAWPTPAASDFKGSTQIGQRRGQLSEAILKHGHPALVTQKDGDESSPLTPSSVRLNPAFVSFLMGWPPGWDLPWPVRRVSLSERSTCHACGRIVCGSAETA